MSRMITIVAASQCTLLINDKTYKTNENGVLSVDVNDLIVSGDRNLFEFDREVDSVLSESQKLELYKTLLEWRQFGISNIQSVLGIKREDAQNILTLAARHRLIIKYFSQWKTSSQDIKTQLDVFIKTKIRNEKDFPLKIDIFEDVRKEVKDEDTQPLMKRTLKKSINIPKKRGK